MEMAVSVEQNGLARMPAIRAIGFVPRKRKEVMRSGDLALEIRGNLAGVRAQLSGPLRWLWPVAAAAERHLVVRVDLQGCLF